MRAVDGNGKSRSTGQCPRYQAHHTGRIYVKRIFQSHCRQSGRQNNEYGQDNQCLSLTPERIEKSRACLYTNRKDKQHQTEVS